MRQFASHHLTAALLLAAASARAQYAPPPPPAPFSGFINEAMRRTDPTLNRWDFGGNVRLRYENKDGFAIYGSPGSIDFRDEGADVENDYFMSRVRFHGGYTDPWWGVYAEGRSSLMAGDERFAYTNFPPVPGTRTYKGNGPEADVVDLHQAYVTVGNLKQFPLALKVGRQELIYGEERLIGNAVWNNIPRVFDAARLRYETEWGVADLFGSRVVIPEDGRFNVDNDYDWFSGLYVTLPHIPKHVLETYLLIRNASASAIAAEPRPQSLLPSARDIYTFGFRIRSKPGELGAWDYSLESAGQLGNFKDRRLGANSVRLEHEAYMVVLQGGYTFDVHGKPRLGFEYSHGSGDSDPNDDKHETFENLFPTNHRLYGYMDFVSLQNIHDVRGIAQVRPHPRLSLSLEGHGFWLADTHDNFYNVSGGPRGGLGTTGGAGYGINPGYSAFVGTELDLICGFAVSRFAQLEAGYGHFFTGEYIHQSLSSPAFGDRDANFLYVQGTIGF